MFRAVAEFRIKIQAGLSADGVRTAIFAKNAITATTASSTRVYARHTSKCKSDQLFRRRTTSLPLTLVGGIASLWATSVMGQSHTVYVTPVIVYEDGYFADLQSPNVAAVFADSQVKVAAFGAPYDGRLTFSALNLRSDQTSPYNYIYNGVPGAYLYDMLQCAVGVPNGCSTVSPWGTIVSVLQCPLGSSPVTYSTVNNGSTISQSVSCPVTIPDTQPRLKTARAVLATPSTRPTERN